MKLNISSEQLFPRPDSNSAYHGTEIITELKKKVQLNKPNHFTVTGLRHHEATSVFCYTKNMKISPEVLANFMGHAVDVQKGYNEMPLLLIQKVLVGIQLLEMTKRNNGKDVPDILFNNISESSGNETNYFNEQSGSGCSSS